MYAKIEFKNGEVYILRCPRCGNALGINPWVIHECDKCKTKIEHTEKYVKEWMLYCNKILSKN